ncbi:MAG TPA: hypothetical protein VIY49_35455 [Bryobacteraceae bacterium]
MSGNPVYRQLQSRQEIVAEASSSALVPLKGFFDVRRRIRGGRRSSPSLTANPAKDLVQRNTSRTVAIKLVEPSIQLITLRLGQGDGFGRCRETFPEISQELKLFLGTETIDI